MPQLEGHVEPQADEISRLKRELKGLERELEEARDEAETAKKAAADSIQVIRVMRKVFGPPYDALKMVFGEMSRVEAEAIAGEVSAPNRQVSPGKYEAWKARVSNSERAVIEVLEISPMTVTQISKGAKIHYDTAKTSVRKLIEKGIAVRNGNEISLKP